jgi:hypothetical protein
MGVAEHDAIHFELADFLVAVRLARLLSPTWQVIIESRDGINIVTPHLRPRPDDFAVVLRTVERWIEEESLLAILYEIDGRKYVLEAGEADWTKAPGARIARTG